MAEVLITLAIIGVIAAITIPSIVANHQKKELEAQFAKMYRSIMQAVNLAVAEHGDMAGWDWKESYTDEEKNEFVKKYFLPYFNVVKFCPKTGEWDCLKNVDYMNLNGTKIHWANGVVQSNNPLAILADGSVIYFAHGNNNLTFNVDINGEKKPNVLGLDAHPMIEISPTGKVIPYRSYEDWSDVLANCNREGWGTLCAQRIIKDGFKINY